MLFMLLAKLHVGDCCLAISRVCAQTQEVDVQLANVNSLIVVETAFSALLFSSRRSVCTALGARSTIAESCRQSGPFTVMHIYHTLERGYQARTLADNAFTTARYLVFQRLALKATL